MADIDLSIYDSSAITENVSLLLSALYVSIYESISIAEDIDVVVPISINEGELFVITEHVDLLIDELFNNIYEEITIVEDVVFDIPSDVDIYDSISITEDITVDSLIDIAINDSIAITEYVNLLDLVIDIGPVYDSVNVTENVSFLWSGPLNDFLRGYPYIEVTLANIDTIQFDNGVEQIVDRWGRVKRRFDISWPVSTKTSAIEIRDFYKENIGKSMTFLNPLDNQSYTVRFLDNSYRLERRHYDTYYAATSLIEVF